MRWNNQNNTNRQNQNEENFDDLIRVFFGHFLKLMRRVKFLSIDIMAIIAKTLDVQE